MTTKPLSAVPPMASDDASLLMELQSYRHRQLAAIRDGHHVVITSERLRELEEYEWKYKELCK